MKKLRYSRYPSLTLILGLVYPGWALANTQFTLEAEGSIQNLQSQERVEVEAGKAYSWNGKEPVAIFQPDKPPVVVVPADFKGDLDFRSLAMKQASEKSLGQSPNSAEVDRKPNVILVELSHLIELESRLQNKLRSILLPYDGSAIVAVNIQGDRFAVQVRSQQTLPTELRKLLFDAIPQEATKKDIQYHTAQAHVSTPARGIGSAEQIPSSFSPTASAACHGAGSHSNDKPVGWMLTALLAVLWAAYSYYRLKKIS